MKDIKAIFIDIDNTIFDHIKKHEYDKKSLFALNKLHDKGIKVIICSARPIYSLREFKVFDKLNYDGIIASNGAVRVYQGEWFDKYIFPKNELIKIIEICKQNHLCLECVTYDQRFYATEKTKDVDFHHQTFFEFDACQDTYNQQDVISMLLFAPKEMDNILQTEMPNTVHMFRFSDYGLDVLIKSHNKGEAVASMLKKMNINSNNALAFGDDYQDISMFEQVKFGVAVGNAKDELKHVAYRVAKPVYKHGVYKFLKKQKLLKD